MNSGLGGVVDRCGAAVKSKAGLHCCKSTALKKVEGRRPEMPATLGDDLPRAGRLVSALPTELFANFARPLQMLFDLLRHVLGEVLHLFVPGFLRLLLEEL